MISVCVCVIPRLAESWAISRTREGVGLLRSLFVEEIYYNIYELFNHAVRDWIHFFPWLLLLLLLFFPPFSPPLLLPFLLLPSSTSSPPPWYLKKGNNRRLKPPNFSFSGGRHMVRLSITMVISIGWHPLPQQLSFLPHAGPYVLAPMGFN